MGVTHLSGSLLLHTATAATTTTKHAAHTAHTTKELTEQILGAHTARIAARPGEAFLAVLVIDLSLLGI